MSSSRIAVPDPHATRRRGLREVLRRVPDHRDRRGVRYRLDALLAASVTAVLAGAQSFAAVGEWIFHRTPEQLDALGLPAAPDESTLRKVYAQLDADAFDRQLQVWSFTRTRPAAGRRVIAIDGKTVRGARTRHRDGTCTSAPHLVSAFDHQAGAVLGQLAVADKSNEIPAVPRLLAGFDPVELVGAVVTVDAMHTQKSTAETIIAAGAEYVFTVKGNTPTLHGQLKTIPWQQIPSMSSTETGHGCTVTRTIKVVEAPDWVVFPGARQIAQLRRTRTVKGKRTVEVVYLITSADHRAAQPATLAGWVRGHWGIENRVHWVRDVAYREDHSQVRTGTAPQVMASLRNTAITIARIAGWRNIASANRYHSWHPHEAITCMLTS